jgi:hypothetical protein
MANGKITSKNIKDTMDESYASGANEKTNSGKSFFNLNGTIAENWYMIHPYTFKFTSRDGQKFAFHLPISPSNLNITTHFATNVISTMYGTVEEHSEQRYFDITISGTTGMSPKYHDITDIQKVPSGGRSTFTIKDSFLPDTGGFFKRTKALIEKTVGKVSELINGPDKAKAGIDFNATGYMAFHNFYRFLLLYKKDTSGEINPGVKRRGDKTSSGHPLTFINFKDNNQYDVAISTFNLTRDASNPLLYNYNIVMRGYNLRTAGKDVLAKTDVDQRSKILGLTDVKSGSIFSKMANKVKKAKDAAYSAIGGAKGFGS